MNVRLGVHTPILILLVGGVVATLAANTASAGGETVAGPGQWVDPYDRHGWHRAHVPRRQRALRHGGALPRQP